MDDSNWLLETIGFFAIIWGIIGLAYWLISLESKSNYQQNYLAHQEGRLQVIEEELGIEAGKAYWTPTHREKEPTEEEQPDSD